MINMGSLLVRVGILFVVFLPFQYLKYPKVGLNNHGIVKNGLGGLLTLIIAGFSNIILKVIVKVIDILYSKPKKINQIYKLSSL